jgi:hypothetical protein
MKIVFSNVGVEVDMSNDKMLKLETRVRIGNYYQLCILYHKTYNMKLCHKFFYKNKKMKYLSITEISRIMDVLINKCQFDVKFVSIIIWREKYINL